VYSLGKADSGDFTYDYATNPLIVKYSGIANTTVKARRLLQGSTSGSSTSATTITSPVMCIKAGAAVLFSINSSTGSYPVYVKNSILNTNKNFDYGPFLDLASTVSKGLYVSTFTSTFDEQGIYVF
jgi:hypothetical protein